MIRSGHCHAGRHMDVRVRAGCLMDDAASVLAGTARARPPRGFGLRRVAVASRLIVRRCVVVTAHARSSQSQFTKKNYAAIDPARPPTDTVRRPGLWQGARPFDSRSQRATLYADAPDGDAPRDSPTRQRTQVITRHDIYSHEPPPNDAPRPHPCWPHRPPPPPPRRRRRRRRRPRRPPSWPASRQRRGCAPRRAP